MRRRAEDARLDIEMEVVDVLDRLGLGRKSLVERWMDRLRDAAESTADALERTGERARDAAETVRSETGARLSDARERARDIGERTRERVRSSPSAAERVRETARRARSEAEERREELAGRMDAFIERAERLKRRRSAEPRRRERRRPESPMRLDVRGDDRVTLRGRRSVDVRTSDGGMVRYRYYERPGLLRRLYFHLTGRRVWPRR